MVVAFLHLLLIGLMCLFKQPIAQNVEAVILVRKVSRYMTLDNIILPNCFFVFDLACSTIFLIFVSIPLQ